MNNLKQLSEHLKQRNKVENEISRIIGRPAGAGHLGEYIASEIFDIELAASATQKGYDGKFKSGPQKGKSVNIKYYGLNERILDITTHELDYYLVLTGPYSPAGTSRGKTRPFVINSIFLFDAKALINDLTKKGVKIGVASSVKKALWDEAKIYPNINDNYPLDENQKKMLNYFCDI